VQLKFISFWQNKDIMIKHVVYCIISEGRNLELQHWGYSSCLVWSWRMEELNEWVNVINLVKCLTVSYHCVCACSALYLQAWVKQKPWKCNADHTLCSCRQSTLAVLAGSLDSRMYRCHCLCAELCMMSHVINGHALCKWNATK